MNITGRQTRTTIVFGFICAVAFVPARMITDYIDLIQYPHRLSLDSMDIFGRICVYADPLGKSP